MNRLETERLLLRTWHQDDLQSMAEINQDPEVMAYFPRCQRLEETKCFIDRAQAHFEQYGYALYAVERKGLEQLIGFIGLATVSFHAPFTPATEIGWRLSSKHWGQGLATEGAKAVLEQWFVALKKQDIVSFTAKENKRSIRVMQKIGLKHAVHEAFDHPNLDDQSPLKPHVLYRLSCKEYHQMVKPLPR